MTLDEFLQHWSILENPFRAEEARRDGVLLRMSGMPGGAPGGEPERHPEAFHSDFEKILGDLASPSSSIVFGEKGSGKTAIRLQIEERIRRHNAAHPDARVLLVAYDDLNAILDRLHQRLAGRTPAESLAQTRTVDHVDGILHGVVPRVVDAILERPNDAPLDLSGRGGSARRRARRVPRALRDDLLLLQAVYDRPDRASLRTGTLRRRLGVSLPWRIAAGRVLMWLYPSLLAAFVAWARFFGPESMRGAQWMNWLVLGLCGLYVLFVLRFIAVDWAYLFQVGRRIRKQVRVIPRSHRSYAFSLRQLRSALRDPSSLPLTDSDEQRYAALRRLRCVLGGFGYTGVTVVVDRVDEPTLIGGDPDRMRAVIWPLLSNKFLQQDGLGIKMLLPTELRHAILKESSAFFQSARLDKQCLVERLSWSGPTLYDLCNARLEACRAPGVQPVTVLDLFGEEVTRRELLDALEQLHQPRDAFKFLYRCMAEHCAAVTRDNPDFRIPRAVFDQVRKQEIERVQQFYRGIRPA
ncbi:MAG: hypothetical protein FJ255_04895 [Phycisphaerae bacterium]|nr:hypothetical protein [Phycisphaerae bacterium]